MQSLVQHLAMVSGCTEQFWQRCPKKWIATACHGFMHKTDSRSCAECRQLDTVSLEMEGTGRNTLILHNGSLGDLLLSLPAMRCIQEDSGPIHLAGKGDVVEFLRLAHFADEVSSSGRSVLLSLYNGDADENARRFLAPFRKAYLFSEQGNSAVALALNKVIPEVIVIFTRPSGTTMHVADYQMQQLRGCEMGGGAPLFLDLPPALSQRARSVLFQRGVSVGEKPVITIHPGSGGKEKNWPAGRFAELVRMISSHHNFSIIILLGPAEEAWQNDFFLKYSEKGGNAISLFSRADLGLVSGILSLSDVYLGNDSGITHLASVVNKKTVAIYGPTDPTLWAPAGRNAVIIVSGRDCVPCGEMRRRCITRDCLDDIGPDIVYHEVMDFLRQNDLSGDQGIRTILP